MFSLILKGVAIGVANIIPGVSGGTLAVILGVYDQLIAAIQGFFTEKENRKSHFIFLAQIGIGAILGVFAFASLIDILITSFTQPTFFFFIGLILASIPILFQTEESMTLNPQRLVSGLIALAIVVALSLIPEAREHPSSALFVWSFSSVAWILVSSAIAAGAMVVPGISGSFLLLLFGTYTTILQAISSFSIPILALVGIGAGIGIIGFSKFISWCLSRYHGITYYAIIGLMLGSTVKLWPGLGLDWLSAVSIVSCGLGAGLVYLLGNKN